MSVSLYKTRVFLRFLQFPETATVPTENPMSWATRRRGRVCERRKQSIAPPNFVSTGRGRGVPIAVEVTIHPGVNLLGPLAVADLLVLADQLVNSTPHVRIEVLAERP